MNYKPPVAEREFRYWISANAVDRFREVVAEEKRKLADRDLALHLDELVHQALINNKVTLVIDQDSPGDDTRIVQILARDGKTAMVVMRNYQPSGYPRPKVIGGPGIRAPGAVTVLSGETAAANFASGRWKAPNRPFADKLVGVQPTPVVPIAAAPTPPTHRQVIPVLPQDPPGGHARGGTVIERIEFVKEVLRQRPNIKHSGTDGLQQLVKAKFGTGMSTQVVQQIRDSMGDDLPAAPVKATAPSTPPAASKLATQLAEALAHEARSKAVLAEAQLTAREATEDVERIMAELTALRK